MRAIVLLWGFAEATLFFVIPDVWITWVALHGLRNGLSACAWALAGALAGGALVYWWAHENQMWALAVFDRLPAISSELMLRAQGHVEQFGGLGLLLGGFSGVPYKLYAAMAESVGIGFSAFLLYTVPARGLRFVAFALLAWALARWLLPRIGLRRLRLLWLAAWGVGYGLYWTLMPG